LVLEEGARLLTLSGPGGVGKTRLALAAASLLEPELAEGVRFVDLAPLSDATLVPSAIGRACGLVHDNAQAPMLPLTRALRDRELLLLIDNFEHVIDAATELGQLVEACPRLRVIVTSREPLRLRSEWEYPVEPLPLPRVPGPAQISLEEVDAIAHNPSVALFVQRARAVRPNFAPAQYFECLVADAVPRLSGSEQRAWLDVLMGDLDNLRATLRWLIDSADQESLHRAAALNWLLWPFWWARGYLSEARRWSQLILDQPATCPGDRARAAWVASTAALDEGDYTAAPALISACLAVFRESGDAHGLARALLVEGWLGSADWRRPSASPGRASRKHRALSSGGRPDGCDPGDRRARQHGHAQGRPRRGQGVQHRRARARSRAG
jgi:predicted ATPase